MSYYIKNNKNLILIFAICLVDLFLLLYNISELSISYKEAEIFFHGKGVLHYLIVFSSKIFGQNDFALRLPSLVFYFLSILLLYKISKKILNREIDTVICICIFISLPGVIASAILVNEAILVIFLTLLFIWLQEIKKYNYSYLVLIFTLFMDNSFSILYLSLFFYGIVKKDKELLFLSLILFTISMYWYGFKISGKPKGYFLDTIGIYSTVFSPLVFLYFIYAMYRISIKETKHLIWYISFGALIFSLIFSLRQKLNLEDFLPYAVISLPLMIKVFLSSYRVRLPIYRKWYLFFLVFVLISLFLNSIFIFFNKTIYWAVKSPDKHFVYKYHVAKELSYWLKEKGIYEVRIEDFKMSKRLEFYKIKTGDKYILEKIDPKFANENDFLVIYMGEKISSFRLKNKN